jgi:hypothetical protein
MKRLVTLSLLAAAISPAYAQKRADRKIAFEIGLITNTFTGQPFMPVFETQKDHFEYDVVPTAIEFERDASGKIIRLHLHQNGLKLPASKRVK